MRLRRGPARPPHPHRVGRGPRRQLGGARRAGGRRCAAGGGRHPGHLPRPLRAGRAPGSGSTGRSSPRSARSRPTTAATRRAAPRTAPAPAGRCSSCRRPSPTPRSSPGSTDPDICDPADAIPAAAAYLKSQRRSRRLAARPVPLQPGRLVPAAGPRLGPALRLRRASRLAARRPDHPGLRADRLRPRARPLLRGPLLRPLPHRHRHRGAARHAGAGHRRRAR